MENLQILVVEDDHAAARVLETHLQEMGCKKFEIVGGEKALDRIVTKLPDVVLTEITLKGAVNGISLAKQAKHLRIPFIFITHLNDRKVYEETKETFTFGYLLKPYDHLTLQSLIENAAKASSYENNLNEGIPYPASSLMTDRILIKSNNMFLRVLVDDILYIQGEGNYCTVNLQARKYIVRMSLKKMYDELDKDRFVAVHRSFIVQLNKIDALELSANKVFIGKDHLPIGPNFKHVLLDRFRLLK